MTGPGLDADAPIKRLATKTAFPSRPKGRPERIAAPTAPIARVCVDVGLAHLDRPFDYLVPTTLDDTAQPGVRVRVRFAGQMLDGIVLERTDASEHTGKLAFVEKVVSPVRVLSAEVARTAREIADRYAGTLADVIRLAVPPRHARAEAALLAAIKQKAAPATVGQAAAQAAPIEQYTPDALARETEAAAPAATDLQQAAQAPASDAKTAADTPRDLAEAIRGWRAYPNGPAFLHALGAGRAARAVWTALPGEDWPARIAQAVTASLHGGRGALVIVADARDLDRVDAALTEALGGRYVSLSAALGPQERYRRFLRVVTGEIRVVVGHRAASFAPVADLGLVVIWDDGDDAHAEPRAPYPHAREVLLTRALQQDAAVLVGGFARTVEAAQLIDNGWAREIVADRDAIRRAAPLVTAVGDDMRDPEAAAARMPAVAWRAARDALAEDRPVLVQVPRRGYLPAVACAVCRAPARCPHCQGPLSLRSAAGQATCRWCARAAAGWACATCGGRSLRASIVGARRTAEELGRVFAGVPVRTSGRDGVLATVESRAGVIVSTPGAEPIVAGGGYGAVLLLDTWALLTRSDLRAGEETLRRWMAAAALALPADRGGRVVVVADGGLTAVQALVRFDPGWMAARDLAERRELGFPPTVRMASLTGTAAAVADLIAAARLPAAAELLGPVPLAEDQERYLVRVPRSAGRALSDALHAASGVRSARKSPDAVRIQIDPLELL